MKSKLQKKMVEDMQLRGYAKRTQTTYSRAVRQLENYWHLPAEEVSEQQVRDYFLYCKNEALWSGSTMRIAYSGIKFFYTATLPMEWETIKLLKIKRLSTPPMVLSVDEVRLILSSAHKPQVKAFLTTVYSCGLRLSEALFLEVGDVDQERMTVRVRDGRRTATRSFSSPRLAVATTRGRPRNDRWRSARCRERLGAFSQSCRRSGSMRRSIPCATPTPRI